MNDRTTGKRLSELLVVLDRLIELHSELRSLIRDKIEHMRAGNAEQLQADTVREESLVKTIDEQEGLRRQLMDAIGRGYGLDPQGVRRMPVRELAERVDETWRSRLLDSAGRLRAVVREVSDLNRIGTLIAQQVLGHLSCAFEAMSAPEEHPGTYSPHGQVVPGQARRLFEMTG